MKINSTRKYCFIIFFITLLIFSFTTHQRTLAAENLKDDFSSLNSRWQVTDKDSVKIENGELAVTSREADRVDCWMIDYTVSNFTLEADVKVNKVPNQKSTSFNDAEVRFRHIDDKTYGARIRFPDNKVYLTWYFDRTSYFLFQANIDPSITNHHLKIVAIGNNIKIYVDDMKTPKINHMDNRQAKLSSGGIGFRSENAAARFDNLVVTTNNSNQMDPEYTSTTEDKDKKDGTSFITTVRDPGSAQKSSESMTTTENHNAPKDTSYRISIKEASNKFISTPKNKYILLKSPIKIGNLSLRSDSIYLKIQGTESKKLFDIKDIHGLTFELGKPQSKIIKIDEDTGKLTGTDTGVCDLYLKSTGKILDVCRVYVGGSLPEAWNSGAELSTLTNTSADLVARIDSTGNLDIIEYGFIYYPTTATNQEDFKMVFLSENREQGKFKFSISDLQPDTEYACFPYVVNELGYRFGKIKYFTTYKFSDEKLSRWKQLVVRIYNTKMNSAFDKFKDGKYIEGIAEVAGSPTDIMSNMIKSGAEGILGADISSQVIPVYDITEDILNKSEEVISWVDPKSKLKELLKNTLINSFMGYTTEYVKNIH